MKQARHQRAEQTRRSRATVSQLAASVGSTSWQEYTKLAVGWKGEGLFSFFNQALANRDVGPFLEDVLFSEAPPRPFLSAPAVVFLTDSVKRQFLRTNRAADLGHVLWLQEEEEAALAEQPPGPKCQQLFKFLSNMSSRMSNAVKERRPHFRPIPPPPPHFATQVSSSAAFDRWLRNKNR